jgi:hypothetical protein
MLKKESLVLFSPLNVIHHYQMLRQVILASGKNIRSFRKVEEANFVAEALVGRRAADGKKYWLRLIDNKEETPDIKTYSWKGSGKDPDEMWEHFIEVVEYERHSSEPIIEFLQKTKLNKYRDDNKLIILCRINKQVNLPSLIKIKNDLIGQNTINPILFCGRISSDGDKETIYRLIQIDPDPNAIPESIDFNLRNELLGMNYEGVLVLDNLGKYSKTKKHYPFESLGFIPKADGSYSLR